MYEEERWFTKSPEILTLSTVFRVPRPRTLAADADLPARSSIADPSPKTNGLTAGRLVCYKAVWSSPGALAPSMVSRRAARGRRAGGWGDAAARGEKRGFIFPIHAWSRSRRR
jgi:hypothetical protein